MNLLPERECLVCKHPEREKIEARILAGDSGRSISLTYANTAESFSIPVVSRHRRQCIPSKVNAAIATRVVQEGLNTLETAHSVVENSKRLGELAEDHEDYRTALVAQREIARGTELYARLTGELARAENPMANPQFLRAVDLIFAALAPYPEALEAVRFVLVKEANPPTMVQALPSSESSETTQVRTLDSDLTQ